MPTQARVLDFALADAASVSRNISIYLNSVEFGPSNDVLDTTTYGAVGHTFVTSLTNGTITISGLWDKTASTGSDTVLFGLIGVTGGAPRAFIYGPEGSTATNVKYTGSVVVQDYSQSAPVADLVTFSATLQVSGAVTKGVY